MRLSRAGSGFVGSLGCNDSQTMRSLKPSYEEILHVFYWLDFDTQGRYLPSSSVYRYLHLKPTLVPEHLEIQHKAEPVYRSAYRQTIFPDGNCNAPIKPPARLSLQGIVIHIVNAMGKRDYK